MQVLPEATTAEPVRVETPIDEQRLPIGGFFGALPATRWQGLARIRTATGQVLEGKCRLVILSGEPGVGKTRLAQEATLQARNLGFLIASAMPDKG